MWLGYFNESRFLKCVPAGVCLRGPQAGQGVTSLAHGERGGPGLPQPALSRSKVTQWLTPNQNSDLEMHMPTSSHEATQPATGHQRGSGRWVSPLPCDSSLQSGSGDTWVSPCFSCSFPVTSVFSLPILSVTVTQGTLWCGHSQTCRTSAKQPRGPSSSTCFPGSWLDLCAPSPGPHKGAPEGLPLPRGCPPQALPASFLKPACSWAAACCGGCWQGRRKGAWWDGAWVGSCSCAYWSWRE